MVFTFTESKLTEHALNINGCENSDAVKYLNILSLHWKFVQIPFKRSSIWIKSETLATLLRI